MDRLTINDIMMSAYISTLPEGAAEKCKKIYEMQRVEIMANDKENKWKTE